MATVAGNWLSSSVGLPERRKASELGISVSRVRAVSGVNVRVRGRVSVSVPGRECSSRQKIRWVVRKSVGLFTETEDGLYIYIE